MAAAGQKVKILLVGRIGDQVDPFVKKITTLQKSKAGPFHACFCVGKAASSLVGKPLPLPVYLQDGGMMDLSAAKQKDSKDDSADAGADKPTPEGIVELSKNLYVLKGPKDDATDILKANIWSVPVGKTELVVASCPPHARLDSETTKPLQEKLSHASYVGCDLFLTSEWPQGIEAVLGVDDTQPTMGSFDVSDLALRSRPRYHVAPSPVFRQSNPFQHLRSSTSTFSPKHTGRFIGMGQVLSVTEFKAKGKSAKFIHALGLTPLHAMAVTELDAVPANLQPCPYTDTSYQKDEHVGPTNGNNRSGNGTTNMNIGLSEAHARRILAEKKDDYRFQAKKRKANDRDSGVVPNDGNMNNVDESITTLFVFGLQNDLSGSLRTDTTLLNGFRKYGATRIRRLPNKGSFVFVEFDTHDAAKRCLQETGGEIEVANVTLSIKWANKSERKNNNNNNSRNRNQNDNRNDEGQKNKRQRLTEAEAMESSRVYFRTHQIGTAGEELRQLMESVLEKALGDPDVTAATEPALQVKLHNVDLERHFGFLDFASHAAASMALASLTGSTDGGPIVQTGEVPVPTHLEAIPLLWSKNSEGNPNGKKKRQPFEMETASGVKFQRKHFPADSRSDCWFCLASDACEKHLITSVHNECYLAMPKGPIDPGHILIVPVAHTGKGALADPMIADEMDLLKQRLRQHASAVYDKELFVFERAIQTKGGYHTHVQCIPVPRGSGMNLQATLLAMAKAAGGFELREINSDLGLAAFANSSKGDEDLGYFYAEVPTSAKEYKRFIYKADASARRRSVPLQFGREVLASVLDNPDFAHWKACVLDTEKETELSAAFRKSFESYEP